MNIETAVKFPTGTLSSPTRSYGNWSFSLLFNCFTHGKDRRKLFVIDTPSYLFSFEHLKIKKSKKVLFTSWSLSIPSSL